MKGITATKFQDPPHSAWGFHDVRELHPTARVWRGAGPVWELPRRDEDVAAPSASRSLSIPMPTW